MTCDKLKFTFMSLSLILFLLTACSVGSGIDPKAGAVFSGELILTEAGENGTATGGDIKFAVSADGKGIESMSFNLHGNACNADGISIQGGGISLQQTPPEEVKKGHFIWEDADFLVEGSFTSSTEANGTITIKTHHRVQMSLNSPATKEITCDYGTWTWEGSAD